MEANSQFRGLNMAFWANVRTIGEAVGYTRDGGIRIATLGEVVSAYAALGLRTDHLVLPGNRPTALGEQVLDYLRWRSVALHRHAEPNLMDATEAKALFESHRKRLRPKAPIPMNKQRGAKKAPAYLTGLVNMLIEAEIGERPCNYDPRNLTTFTRDGYPACTLARRVDGAFPAVVNPLAVWEVKEYYYTTTFGSRVADGVYETLLDGMELRDLREECRIPCEHLLIADAKLTWWKMGKSYLCRIVDMLQMGLVDHVLFGREVVDELPRIAANWTAQFDENAELYRGLPPAAVEAGVKASPSRRARKEAKDKQQE